MHVYLEGGPRDGEICALQFTDMTSFEITSYSYYDATRRRGHYVKQPKRVVEGRPVFKFGGWGDPEWDD